MTTTPAQSILASASSPARPGVNVERFVKLTVVIEAIRTSFSGSASARVPLIKMEKISNTRGLGILLLKVVEIKCSFRFADTTQEGPTALPHAKTDVYD